jgi:hypothetical protein
LKVSKTILQNMDGKRHSLTIDDALAAFFRSTVKAKENHMPAAEAYETLTSVVVILP